MLPVVTFLVAYYRTANLYNIPRGKVLNVSFPVITESFLCESERHYFSTMGMKLLCDNH